MWNVLAGMAMLILAGVVWRRVLGAERAQAMRIRLAAAVYEVFLPALVFHVMWKTTVDLNLLRIPFVAAASVSLSLLAALWIYGDGRRFGGRKAAGAMLLASGFGNFTYLGLPVLTRTFGPWAQSVAIPFDLFASTPLLFTVGILLARRYGSGGPYSLSELTRVPALWAALSGLGLNILAVPMAGWMQEGLRVAGAAVVPLMLLSVGMALSWPRGSLKRLPLLVPMLLIQLGLMPLIAWGACILVGMPEKIRAASVIEAAMPCMVLGLVLCDRFRLDSVLYAQAVTSSTILSLLTLPLWLRWVG